METYGIGFLLLLALGETMALHIVISPDEASKIMKRDDEFSKGLAGFIERTVSGSKHVKVTKREKINELKSMIQRALDEVDQKKDYEGQKKDAQGKGLAPPALPLDINTKRDVRELEAMVDKLLDEESERAKRQGWIHYGKKKNVEEGKKQLEDQAKEMQYSQGKLDQIYEKVKRLVSLAKGSRAKDATAEEKRDDVIITDSGDVGSRMLAKVKKMIAEKNARKANGNEIIRKLKELTKRLTAGKVASSDVGELSLNAIKKIIAEKAKDENTAEVNSHPRSKARDTVTIDTLLDEVNGLLRKMKPMSGSKGEKKFDEVAKTDVAVESKERPVHDRPRDVHTQRRKELITKLIRTYDALTKGSDESSDAVEEELEKLSTRSAKRATGNSGKVSKETAEAIKGFDIPDSGKKRVSHPK